MRADVQSVFIEADAEQVVDLLASGADLPRWAIGFAASVEPDGDGWTVTTGSGDRVPLRIATDRTTGAVDYVLSPAPGLEATAWTRTHPTGEGCVVTFLQVQAPGMPDGVFEAQVRAVTHELAVLRSLAEVACPL